MDLEDLEWGDVLADTGDVLVAAAELVNDGGATGGPVVVKRWAAGALDAELTARRLLAAAGVPTAPLLGWGPGWLVLEDLSATMWRPARPGDLADPAVLRGLARWFAATHAVAPEGLPPDATRQLLRPELLDLAASALPPDLSPLPGRVAGWAADLDRAPRCLVVDALLLDEVRVVGAGLDAMPTDLASCQAGPAAADLAACRESLCAGPGAAAWRLFQDEYQQAAARPVPDWELVAARGLRAALPVVVSVLTGVSPDPVQLAVLGELLEGTGPT